MSFILPILIVALSMGVGAGAVVYFSERVSNAYSYVFSGFIGLIVGILSALAYPAKAFDGGAIYAYVGAGVLSCLFLNRIVKWANDAG
ncbi:hypothetical protein [Ruegeria sp. YS9]|uniref:hypothetical protein n=1 Tax=Ruegeria sp. YS9 TaxID=2966453 RepID=UPI00214B8BBF|nr:hypothetical protein [Ruegeria sp. YS9]UUV06041.1 hypothetical protein NOR97_15705 [Ruegeria sp. YS9]